METSDVIERPDVASYLAGFGPVPDAAEIRVVLWLSWLDQPWEFVRRQLIGLMERERMSHEDLAFELRKLGYHVSHATIGNWLRGEAKKAPPLEALQGLVTVFAKVEAKEWTKGSEFTQARLPYAS